MATLKYTRRRRVSRKNLAKINGKSWLEASKILGLKIPSLFIYLAHARKLGLIRDVRIK